MHIDHSKFIELLVEASGMEKDVVEKHLTDLVEEITQTLKEGEAYEVDGFGVFSGFGNNIIFIPSTELSTEINYKYVGMEPLVMDEHSAEDTDEDAAQQEPQEPEGAQAEESEAGEDDPFAGLLDDVEDDEPEVQNPIVSASKEESEDAPNSDEDPFGDVGNFDDFDPFEEIAKDPEPEPGKEPAPPLSAAEEESDTAQDSEEDVVPSPGPDKWGIDTYKDSDAENMFSSMLGNGFGGSENTNENKPDGNKDQADSFQFDPDFDDSDSGEESSEKEEVVEFDDEFDDPFKNMTEEELEEFSSETENSGNENDDDIFPVITNISSGKGEKEPKEKKKKQKIKPLASKRQSSPAFLWVLLIILIIGGGTYGLAWFGVIDIDVPGLPEKSENSFAQNEPTTPALTESPEQQEPVIPEEPESEMESSQENQTNESEPEDPSPTDVGEQGSNETVSEDDRESEAGDQPLYGMKGMPVAEANDGYTIVIFSLTRESNANNQRRELTDLGYRALVYPMPSSQYGTIWRVSLGQFESLRDAAIAAESLSEPYSQNYFITKIQ